MFAGGVGVGVATLFLCAGLGDVDAVQMLVRLGVCLGVRCRGLVQLLVGLLFYPRIPKKLE